MKTYLITDSHFGHSNIKKYCDRPESFEELIFEDLSDLSAAWKRIDDDVQLVHLGDVAMGKEPETWLQRYRDATKRFRTVLIIGNHDKKTKTYYKKYFDEVLDNMIVQDVYLSHYGVDVIPEPARMQVYGHHHNSPLPEREKAWKNSFQLSLEREYYKTVELDEVRWRILAGIKY